MISAQIDELRAIADKDTVPYEASDAMYQAADTIWHLRDDLQRANAENAKLREEFDKMDVWHSKELTAAMADNAKLRELVKSMYYDLINMTFPPDWVTDYEADMRELGVEVDDG